LQPEVSPFCLRNVDAQYILASTDIQTEDCIYSPGNDLALVTDLVVNSIHPDKGIDLFKRPGLPFPDDRQYVVGNRTEGRRRDLYPYISSI